MYTPKDRCENFPTSTSLAIVNSESKRLKLSALFWRASANKRRLFLGDGCVAKAVDGSEFKLDRSSRGWGLCAKFCILAKVDVLLKAKRGSISHKKYSNACYGYPLSMGADHLPLASLKSLKLESHIDLNASLMDLMTHINSPDPVTRERGICLESIKPFPYDMITVTLASVNIPETPQKRETQQHPEYNVILYKQAAVCLQQDCNTRPFLLALQECTKRVTKKAAYTAETCHFETVDLMEALDRCVKSKAEESSTLLGILMEEGYDIPFFKPYLVVICMCPTKSL
ncbi:hypothetical protein HW555_008313 [Spodoptera exigua]|uniref:Ubiquinol-cytochrome C reductase hinge domain-containing protein n=1 Tax=Spodoptera exigua TaxID=7107 RepID=A0A835L2V0_SPOEX|nr:hypothetical protein HW555_008313 [Spodoptera exigua]